MGSTDLEPDTTRASEAVDTTPPPPPEPSKPGITRGRRIFISVLIGITSVLLVVAIFSVWANRLLFNPDNWSNTSTQLLQNQQIRSTTANYLVDQLYANVNVPDLIKSGLPPQLQGLAAPAAGALRNAAVQGVNLALERPRVQQLWATANRAADQTFINVVNGGHGAVGVKQGVVTLNLGLIVDNVAARLGLPSDISSKLPANIAMLTVLKSNQLKVVQDGGKAIKGLALALTILCPLLYALAIALARGRRRRTLMTVGSAMVTAGIVSLLGKALLESQGTNAITNDASLRPTVRAVFSISTGMISEIGGAVIVVGAVLILSGWFAGPAKWARSWREAIAPFLREHPASTYSITIGIMVLIFLWQPIPATGKPAGMIVFLLLALFGTFLLRRQTASEFPEARSGAATEKLRARLAAMRSARERTNAPSQAPAPAQPTISQQLRELSDLRERGELSPDEYQAAKTHLLHHG